MSETEKLIVANEVTPAVIASNDGGSADSAERWRSAYLEGAFDMATILSSFADLDPTAAMRFYTAIGLEPHFAEPEMVIEKVGNSLRLKN